MQSLPKRLLHGGDYSPEQWPPAQWQSDLDKMALAGANVLTLGIFAWSALEPSDGEYQLDWLEEVMGLLAERGCHAILATPSAAQPAWMSAAHPEILRAPEGGIRNRPGMRVNFCITSPYYRQKCADLNRQLAMRLGKHPALIAWHISNEYCSPCFCAVCEEAFRGWLQQRYLSLEQLNHRWNSAFWSHTYTDWAQIDAPGGTGEKSSEALWVNWKRFTSDQYASFIRNEVEPIREHSPDIPVTTNLMGTHEELDYWRFAAELDFVSMDAYPSYDIRSNMIDIGVEHSFVFDLMRSLKQGRPWILMETTPSSANWMQFMKLKRPGIHRLASMQALAHGSDAVLYFQWRRSMGGREKLHGAVLDHTGSTDTRVFREVAEVGELLKKLQPVAGSTGRAEVAVIFDWQNRWAIDATSGPVQAHKNYLETCIDHYRAFWQQGIPADVIESTEDFSPYRLVIAPMLYLLRPAVAGHLTAFVENGGTLVGTYWTGLVDDDVRLFDSPFPGPLRDLFGIENEETDILYPDESAVVMAETGNSLDLQGSWKASIFCALIQTHGAEVLAGYGSQFYAGTPAVTRHACGNGAAYYLAFRGDHEFHAQFYGALVKQLSLRPILSGSLPAGVTVQKRSHDGQDFLFLLNFTGETQTIDPGHLTAVDLVRGAPAERGISLEPYGCCIFQLR